MSAQPMDYMRLYVDHPRVGSGWRAFVLLDQGRKWAHVVEPVLGVRLKLPLDTLRSARPIPRPRWSRIARQLKHAGLRALAAQARQEGKR